jgi:hypothetical protein
MPSELIITQIGKLRKECAKVGIGLMFNLQLNFFANYSAVVQAGVARVDTIVMRVEKLLDREVNGKEEVPKQADAMLTKKKLKK